MQKNKIYNKGDLIKVIAGPWTEDNDYVGEYGFVISSDESPDHLNGGILDVCFPNGSVARLWRDSVSMQVKAK